MRAAQDEQGNDLDQDLDWMTEAEKKVGGYGQVEIRSADRLAGRRLAVDRVGMDW